MQKIIQFIQSSPEELEERLFNRLTVSLDNLKSEFQPKEPTEYLTRNEVAQLLKVDLSTVHNWTVKGKLRSYGIGNRVYYKRKELEQSLIPLNH